MATGISSPVVLTPELILPGDTGAWGCSHAHQAYTKMIVTPRGRLNRNNLLAIPKRFTWAPPPPYIHYCCLSIVDGQVKDYNAHAKALGWKSWAVRAVNLERRDFLVAADAASLDLGDRGRDGRFRVTGFWQPSAENDHWLNVDLSIILTDVAKDADMRVVALRGMRKLLREIEQAGASDSKPKLHRSAGKRGAA